MDFSFTNKDDNLVEFFNDNNTSNVFKFAVQDIDDFKTQPDAKVNESILN